jgi:protein-tyrosine phosphatase
MATDRTLSFFVLLPVDFLFRLSYNEIPLVSYRHRLFLGNVHTLQDEHWFRQNKVTYVLSIDHHDTKTPSWIDKKNHKCLSVLDMGNANIKTVFAASTEWIKNSLCHGNILVHCHAGILRSPTIVAAFLIAYDGSSANQAVARIKVARPQVKLSHAFLAQLNEYERGIQQYANSAVYARSFKLVLCLIVLYLFQRFYRSL